MVFWMLHLVHAKPSTMLASLSQKTLDRTAKMRIFKWVRICLATRIRLVCIRWARKPARKKLPHHSKKLSHTSRDCNQADDFVVQHCHQGSRSCLPVAVQWLQWFQEFMQTRYKIPSNRKGWYFFPHAFLLRRKNPSWPTAYFICLYLTGWISLCLHPCLGRRMDSPWLA